jgi:hypothetical protein
MCSEYLRNWRREGKRYFYCLIRVLYQKPTEAFTLNLGKENIAPSHHCLVQYRRTLVDAIKKKRKRT